MTEFVINYPSDAALASHPIAAISRMTVLGTPLIAANDNARFRLDPGQ